MKDFLGVNVSLTESKNLSNGEILEAIWDVFNQEGETNDNANARLQLFRYVPKEQIKLTNFLECSKQFITITI